MTSALSGSRPGWCVGEGCAEGARGRDRKEGGEKASINVLAVWGHELWPLTEENQNKDFIK